MVAAVAAAYSLAPRTRPGAVLLGLVSALAVVSKSTAVIAVAAFGVAQIVGPRAGIRARAQSALPIGVGALAGLGYFAYEAARADLGLLAFLRAGTGGQWAVLADQTRHDALLRVDLLGTDLRLLLCFAALYSAARIAGADHRAAALGSAAGAVAVAWIVPAFATGGAWAGPFADGLDVHAAGFVVLAALLPAAALAAPAAVPSRLVLLRLVVWAAPVLVLWYLHATYAPRLASPSWPPLVLALAIAVALVASGCASLQEPVAVVPVAVLATLVLASLPAVDALRGELWHRFWEAGPHGWTDAGAMRELGLGAFGDELRVVEAQAGSDGLVRSTDERLRFWLGSGRVDTNVARTCSEAASARVFVVLLDPGSVATAEAAAPGAASTDFWSRCSSLVPVWEIPGSFAAYTAGAPRDTSRTVCVAPPRPSGLVAVFGDGLSREKAAALRRDATAVGFGAAAVERTGCAAYAVVLRGFSGQANAADFADEAAAAGFPVTLETLP
jgi:hypothetical protein